MPWCDPCAKYWTPTSVTSEARCPDCGAALDTSDRVQQPRYEAKSLDLHELAGDDARAPWHFKLLVFLTAAYLVWRLVDWLVL
jgi:hypothetical protein